MRLWVILLFWGLVLHSPVGAQTTGRKAIEEFYEGLSLATEMKFPEGMTSHRTPDFQGVDADGRSFDRWSDLYRFRDLFHRSLSVKLKTRILDFSQQGESCRCTVAQEWEITQKSGKAPKMKILNESRVVQDTWVLQGEDWKLSRSVVKSRSLPSVKF